VGDEGAAVAWSVVDESFDLDLLASSLRADGSDVRVLLRVLVDRLAGALGDRLRVERSGGLLRRGNDVRRLTVDLGDDQLEAVVEGGSVRCTVGRSSGGIRIRTTKVTMDEWLRQLLGSLKTEAATSEASRTALEALMLGNGA
jgi:hypothetical protein